MYYNGLDDTVNMIPSGLCSRILAIVLVKWNLFAIEYRLINRISNEVERKSKITMNEHPNGNDSHDIVKRSIRRFCVLLIVSRALFEMYLNL